MELIIKGWETAQYIDAFHLEKAAGQHSRCQFSAVVEETQIAAVLQRVGQPLAVTTDDERPVFFGRIESIARVETQEAVRLDVQAVSDSIAEDEQPHFRLFQDETKTIGDVLEKLEMKDALTVDDKIKSIKYAPFLVQMHETNFQFLCRVARALGTHVWVSDTISGHVAFHVGPRADRTPQKIAFDALHAYTVRHAQPRKTAEICLQQVLALGMSVQLGDETTEYIITGVSIDKRRETFYVTYTLEEAKDMPAPELHLSVVPALSLRAIVTKVERQPAKARFGCVQLCFQDIEDIVTDPKRAWISYRTPYAGRAGGIVFLPEPGDMVEVLVTSEQVFVVSEYRTKPLEKEYAKPEDKYIGNNFEQRVIWKKDALELRSKKSSIILKEKSIELLTGRAKVTLDEKGIYVQYGDHGVTLTDQGIAAKTAAALRMEAAQAVTAKANGALQLETAQGATVKAGSDASVKSGGAIRLDSGAETSVKASSIHLG